MLLCQFYVKIFENVLDVYEFPL